MSYRDEMFDVWAPPGAVWSAWAKPVVFAHVVRPTATVGPPVVLPPMPSVPRGDDRRTAVVVDLPAATSVALAVPLALHGYRPVPLYNAVPGPGRTGVASAAGVRVDLRPVVAAITASAAELRATGLPPTAPPAFLLDADRRVGSPGFDGPGSFDNRSVSLPTDFPSADRLKAAGVEQVVVVQATGDGTAADLAHTLLRWQSAGLVVSRVTTGRPGVGAVPIKVGRPPRFGSLWHGALAAVGLRRNPLGGFGGLLPDPSAG